MTEETILRSPICCVLGHVDVGKTKFLDSLRDSKIQQNEAGGITQQIGATFFHKEYIDNFISSLHSTTDIPGLLFIDTPGHDCFSNLRIRGIEIADIAIVLVDIIKGLETQTIECINLLKAHNTPFIIALNKIDRIADWDNNFKKKNVPLKVALKKQKAHLKTYYDDYCNRIIVQFAEKEINAALYYNNPNNREFVSMVPISAFNKVGMSDLLLVLSTLSSTLMKKKLTFHDNITRGYVMDIYKDAQYGSVLNVILVDGILNKNANAIFCGNSNCVDTIINNIFEPGEGSEMKGMTKYLPQQSVHAAKGIMIKIDNPMDIIPGTKFIVYSSSEQREKALNKLTGERTKLINDITNKQFSKHGIYINSPSYGPLEALWNMCQNKHIDVGNMIVGPITKTELFKVANSIHNNKKEVDIYDYSKKNAVILNYQSETSTDIIDHAHTLGITIIDENIIYKMMTKYDEFKNNIYDTIRSRHPTAVNNFKMEIIPKYIFHKKDPLIFGVKILSGVLKANALVQIDSSNVLIGIVESVEKNKKAVDEAKINDEVCIKIVSTVQKNYTYDIDFNHTNILSSYITAEDIVAQNHFPDVFVEDNSHKH